MATELFGTRHGQSSRLRLAEFGTDGPPLNWRTVVRNTRFKSLQLQHQNWSDAVGVYHEPDGGWGRLLNWVAYSL
jgi:hypothetical protein